MNYAASFKYLGFYIDDGHDFKHAPTYFFNLMRAVLDFSAGVWGLGSIPVCESVPNRAARYCLGVHKHASKLATVRDI